MWLLFAVLSGVFNTAENLFQRFFLKKEKDAWAFAFFYSLVGTLVSFPFMLSSPHVPHQPSAWLLAALLGVLIVWNNILLFISSGMIEMSIIGSLLKLRLVWVFLLGIVLLHDPFSWQKLLGTALAIAAGWVILHNFRRPHSLTGVSLVLAATLFNASIIILSKYLLGSFNAVSLTFFATFLPATIFIFFVMPNATKRIQKIFREDWRMVFIICAFGTLVNLTLNAALSLHDAASVLVVTEAFLVLVLVGEHAILKEREQVWIKLAAVVLAIGGAIMIQLSH
jgi:drug/metabolite transporter (DMT)-like permease